VRPGTGEKPGDLGSVGLGIGDDEDVGVAAHGPPALVAQGAGSTAGD
jgi:hypothetical protein